MERVLNIMSNKMNKKQKLLNKYIEYWNSKITCLQSHFDNDKIEFKNDENLEFKWTQLIQQEIMMYISLCSENNSEDNQVQLEDFNILIKRRGFTPRMINTLKEVLVNIGIGNDLKGDIK